MSADALERSMRVHVPFGGVKMVLDVLPRRDILLVIFRSASIIGARVPAGISGFSVNSPGYAGSFPRIRWS